MTERVMRTNARNYSSEFTSIYLRLLFIPTSQAAMLEIFIYIIKNEF